MKYIILIIIGLFFNIWPGYSQHIDNESKTFYDEAKTKLKEVYSYKEVYTFSATGDQSITKTIKKKHGPYFYYYESGKIKIKGWYKDDKKEKTWEYSDKEGNLIKSEEYKDGVLVKSDL